MQRRTLILLLVLGGVLVAGAAAAQLVAIRGTTAAPSRACEDEGPLRVVFGEPVEHPDGRLSVPLAIENTGDTAQRVLVDSWEVDSYRVRWDGRLSSLGTQSMQADLAPGYTGEDVAPGGRLELGEVQLLDADGRLRLLAFTDDACGSTTFRV